jgi:hypothetical protein
MSIPQGYFMAVEAERTLVETVSSGQDLHERRFSGAVFSD